MAAKLSISNPAPRKLPGPQLLHHLVSTKGEDGAAAVEHTFENGSRFWLTYEEFHVRADALARRITFAKRRSATKSQRTIIPLLLPQCPDLYISQLATLKAGGAFCPIVLDAPEERLRFILGDIDANILLTTATLRTKLPALENVTVLAVDDDNDDNDNHSDDELFNTPMPPTVPSTPEDPAYIMYTSGSTGQPKGVILSHSAACQALLAHDRHIPRFRRFLQFASPTFDVSVFEIFFPWLRGTTLVSCERRRLLNDLPAAINDLRIDACELTPSVASSLLRDRSTVPGLQVLLTIGEMLKPSVVERFGGDATEPAILQGMYGPTEATIHCTLQVNFSKDTSCNCIGVPLDTVSAFIIKAVEGPLQSPEILAIGEEGELAVGGHQLADGYLNREDQTRTAFIQHEEHGTLYRTGDRARMLPDGTIECLGRISSGQVKLRGQRIELGEVEHAASRTTGCTDAVAEVIDNTLVAFCVSGSPPFTQDAVVQTCRKWLPAFMVPGDVVILDSLPYLASGKCDRKALRSQYEERQSADMDDETEHSEHMRLVLHCLKSVLGVQVAPNSSLSSSGLDSLSSIRLAAKLRESGLSQLDAGHVLTARTPVDLCAALHDVQHQEMGHNWQQECKNQYRATLDRELLRVLPRDLHKDVDTSFPCTPVQIAMLTETSKTSTAYCNWVRLALPQHSDPSLVRRGLLRLAELHPLLRSGFFITQELRQSYATIVWRALADHQIDQVADFQLGFKLDTEADFRRPLRFQIRQTNSGLEVLLQLHHALYDQWAVDLLRADLAAIFREETPRQPASFEIVADYYIHRDTQSSLSASREFWQDQLQDVSATSIPLLRGTEVQPALLRTEWQETSLQSSELRSHVNDIGCSAPAVFQSAMAVILGAYAGVSDITFGSVFSGRTIALEGIDTVFGPCLATLPLRIDTRTAKTRRDLLGVVTDRNREIQKHLLISPTAIREAAGLGPGATLFDSLFVWQESTVEGEESEDITEIDSADQLEFNLVLEIQPSPTAVRMRATYQQHLLSPEQVQILLKQIEALALAMLRDPDGPVQEVSNGLSVELLSIVNAEPDNYAADFELTHAIQRRASDDPESIAIRFATDINEHSAKHTQMTYAELDERANSMANSLIEAGVQPGDLVCIFMEKCIDLYVVMLATFKAGAGYLPLVPDTPLARIKSVLRQAAIKLCVCDRTTVTILQSLADIKAIDCASLNSPTLEAPKVLQIGSRVAYAVFTSGSTGEPKGVAVTMDNLKGNLAVLSDLYKVSPGDRLLQSCSHAFDVSVFEIFFTFYTGMCLCSATKDVIFKDFEQSIRSFAITHLSLTPTVAALARPENVPTVKFLVTAGEAITEKVHRTWADHSLHQGYGPSETTNICSVHMNVASGDVLGNIGPPFLNTSAFVLAPEGDFRILPAGAYGEFAFGGEQVFRGYIGRDDLNSSKILTHAEYGRIYRSGDMGRVLPDGTLLISGRLDDQVKIRGNRVELGEINAVVADHPDVADCATVVLGDNSSNQMLATFWVSRYITSDRQTATTMDDQGSRLVSTLYDCLENALPAYMIPSILVPLTKLPVTTQGKLDKRALRTLYGDLEPDVKDTLARIHEVSAQDGPATATEQTMAKAVSRLFEVPIANISRNASLFTLGLNSLNAIQLARAISQKVGSDVSVSAVLRQPSISRLARSLTAPDEPRDSAPSHGSISKLAAEFVEKTKATFHADGHTVQAVLQCTPLQEAMLSVGASDSTDAYCNTTKIHFSGDMDRLRSCWNVMTERQAILRTSFVQTPTPSSPYAQVVLEQSLATWSEVKEPRLNGKLNGTAGHVNGHAKGHANGQANGGHNGGQNGHKPGDTREPRLPGVTHRTPIEIVQHGHEIYLQMHHAVYDGISMSNIFSELRSLYQGNDLPKAVSFEPFLAEVSKQNNREAIDFWTSRLQSFKPAPFPALKTEKHSREMHLEMHLELSPLEIAAFGERHSCTSLSVFQAAWAKTLAQAQGITDLCFGNVVSGRSVPVADVELLVAPCFNTIPVRVQLDSLRTNLDLVRYFHQENIECLPFQLTALRSIQAVSRQPSGHLFDSLLLVQPPVTEDDEWEIEEAEDMGMGLPIVIEVIPHQDDFELLCHYMPGKVDPSTATMLADAFISSLKACLQYSSGGIAQAGSASWSELAGRLAPEFAADISDGSSTDPVSEWTGKEVMVREVFADLAAIDENKISKNTSLYQIGLDSLNAVQVASELRRRGEKVDAADVMQYQSPVSLAQFLSQTQSRGKEDGTNDTDLDAFDEHHRPHAIDSLGIGGGTIEAVRPCTSAQNGMLAQFIQSQGDYYFSRIVYEVPSTVSREQLCAAWAAVQRKHQILRTGFLELEDAKNPFAMLIYKPNAQPGPNLIEDDSTIDDLHKRLSSSVLHDLHLPAWRFAIQSKGASRQLILSLQHALYDAHALSLLLKDFSKALKDKQLGHAPGIDVVLKTQLDGAARHQNESEQFWSDSLGSAQLVKFPNLTPTVVRQSKGASAQSTLRVQMSILDAFCRDQGVTIQAVGQAVWAQLLAAYLGEPAVTFGTVFAGMSSPSTKAVAFPAISTLPVFCNTKRPTLDMIHEMVSYNASAQRHRFTPLVDIQRFAGTPGKALFDTIFVYQKSDAMDDDRLTWEVVSDSLNVDYSASMELLAAQSNELSLRLTYDLAVIPDAHANLILLQFEALLQQVLGEQTNNSLSSNLVSMVPPKEYTLPSEVSLLHQFLERGAEEHPNKPALEFIYSLDGSPGSRKTWTYRELNDRGNQVANLIIQHGINPGNMIAVCMSKSPEATFVFIGILKAGCAFLAMDPDLPLARRKFIVEDSSSQLLFVDSGKNDSELEDVVRNVELVESALVDLPTSNPAVEDIDPSSNSYCLYTSGTTGTPKGCELTHENAVQAMLSFQRLFADHWTSSSRWLQFASYWFDVSVLEHFWSWSVGITMVGAPRDIVLEDLPGFITAANITHIDLTPSLARLLKPEDVPSLHNHVFITGGEALKQEIIDAWGPLHTIYNGYGPTEATIGCTMNVHIGADAKPSNIGPPFDNVGAFVLAPETDEPVLRGAVGELCVFGKLVGKGYLNRPDLTAKAFPYLERLGERVYRTGDLVRLLADGSFSFIGRKDTQAKLRGQRLEIDEIDAVIKAAHSGISDVASLVTKSSEGDREMLVSFLVDSEARHRELQLAQSGQSREVVVAADQACRDRLPGYMVPTHIVPLSRLPLTVNNKVDAKRLVALFSSLSTQDLQSLKGGQDSDRALKPQERKMAKVISKLLSINVKDISVNSNIFSLGLSSVSAINFATLLKRAGFERASVATVMSNPILSQLAHAISNDSSDPQIEYNAIKQSQLSISAFAQRHRSHISKALSVIASTIESIAPCTPLQEGLVADSIKGTERPYFNSFHYQVRDIDHDRLGESILQLHQQLPILRTSFIRTDEGFAQVVLRAVECPLRYEDLEDDNACNAALSEHREQWESLADDDIQRPFEAIIVQSPSHTTLALHAHHAIYDGISWDLMMSKLEEIYITGTVVDYGPSFIEALPYGPLCKRNDAKEFWETRLKGFHFTPLMPLAEQPSSDCATVTRSIESLQSVESLRKSLGISHQAIFQAAFSIALHQYAPQTQTYGVVLSGRSLDFENADAIIGPMFNTVPCAVNMDPTDDWSRHLLRCHESSTTLLPFQHTSLRDIRKYCRRHASDPLFDVLFVFQQPGDKQTSDQGSLFEHVPVDTPAEYPLAIEVEWTESSIAQITAASQPSYADRNALDKFLSTFETALQCIMRKTEDRISNDFTVSRSDNAATPEPRSRTSAQLDGVSAFEWTSEAERLRDIIAEVAGCSPDNVTEHVSIFTLGLDSIDAVKLAARMKKAGLATPVSKILNAQTIPRLLEEITSHAPHNTKPASASKFSTLEQQLQSLCKQFTSRTRADVERVIPAAPGQEALIAEMVRSEFNEYFNSDVLHLPREVDVDRLKGAWQQVVNGSPILRTVFVEVAESDVDATFAQVILAKTALEFAELKVQSLDDLGTYFDAVKQDVRGTFSAASPIRLAVATVQEERYLILSLSHAQYDGHSIGLLHADVAAAYADTYQPRASYDEAIDQALSATSEKTLAYWRDTLAGAKIAHLSQIDDPLAITHRVERVAQLSCSSARGLCQRLGVSLQALAQTSWAVLLATHLQDLEVLFGMVLACRDSEEAEQILFPTMNTVPVRVSLHGSVAQMLRDVQDNINSMREHQRSPLRHIQAACTDLVHTRKHQAWHGLFDTLFIYQNRGDASDDQEKPLYESVATDANVEYPVAVEVEAVGDELLIRAACKSSVLDHAGAEELLKHFDDILNYLAADHNQQIVEFVGDSVTVCGLPKFEPHSGSLSRQTTRDQTVFDDSDEDSADDSLIVDAIRAVLAQVSRTPMEDISPNATIESIGIDSISAIKVVSVLKKQSIKLSVSDLLKAQTARGMAHCVDSAAGTVSERGVSAQDTIASALAGLDLPGLAQRHGFDHQNVEAILPVTAGQVYMLSMWQKTRGELFYPTFSYQLETEKSLDDVRNAWQRLVAMNAVLRTRFIVTGESDVPLLQVVQRGFTENFAAEQDDLHVLTQPFAHLKASKTQSGFSLKLRIHHALYDAVSLPLLMQSLQSLIRDDAPTKHQAVFSDYLALGASAQASKSRQSFWTEYLQEVPPARLQQPDPKNTDRVQIFQPTAFSFCDELERQSRRAGVSTQALFFAAYARIYYRHAAIQAEANGGDVVIGIYLANRTHLTDLDMLEAPTLNLLPLLVKATQQTSLFESAKHIDHDLRKITRAENAAASLADIVDWTGVKVDTFVNFLKLPDQDEQSTSGVRGKVAAIVESNSEWDEEVSRVHASDRTVGIDMPAEMGEFQAHEAYQHALDVELAVKDGKLSMGLFCLEGMVSLEEAKTMAEEFVAELQHVADQR